MLPRLQQADLTQTVGPPANGKAGRKTRLYGAVIPLSSARRLRSRRFLPGCRLARRYFALFTTVILGLIAEPILRRLSAWPA